ncbi:glycosyltransferase [Sphingomonas ginkgonis]|nr:glycosyltransferase [Sphingomonas ginkgonis]
MADLELARTDAPAATPGVTIGLVAFNQEDYVREAVRSALAQVGPPVEIILSDDCSSDSTFSIMAEEARNYRGPHRVRARREAANVGTVQHLINVAREARGDLLVVAAGDDISHPNRAEALHAAWVETGAAALSSWHDEIDEDGRLLRGDVSFPSSPFTQKLFADEPQAQRDDGVVPTVPGFCAAYPRAFWADMPDPPAKLLVEDGLASALILLRGETIHRVPESLISYRLLPQSLTVRSASEREELRRREGKISSSGRELVDQVDYTLAVARRSGLTLHPRTERWFRRARLHGRLTSNFWSASPGNRWARLLQMRTSYDARFLLPRLLGFGVFERMRRLVLRRSG